MNAAEQATSLELTTKIASVVTLFKAQFPMVRVDLKPWSNDRETRSQLDPDSIDIGFHLPGWNPKYECRSMLVQMRFFTGGNFTDGNLTDGNSPRLIGLEVLGFSYNGEQWRLSTVGDWPVVGEKRPAEEKLDLLKTFCRQVYELFNSPPR
ncbi:MAG: hypothetical protein HC824_08980 [Synechococcales cyanobacterium RM1_1_8]|nr:hypothetical protein [Synechococcales cyanobacterium RM1_1_8]